MPDNAWRNDQKTPLYITTNEAEQVLCFNGNCSITLARMVTQSGDNYICSAPASTFTFIMEGDVLKNIQIESESPDYARAVGTYPYTTSDNNDILKKIVKGVAIAAGAAAVVGVAGTVVKNVQKAAVAQQMAYKTKMQQKAVQKQAATIKTVLKGAGVVLSLAQFTSSLSNLFKLNQFGYTPFGFR